MGEFYVEHQAVRTFGTTIGKDGLGGDAGEAKTYHSTWAEIPADAGTGIFANFRGIATDAFSSADSAIGHLKRILNASGTELESAADMYQTTDEQSAADLDAQY
ncbi:hypothetical protein EXU48_10050 [Occultella glacieicola]|uniref:Excreted virulence factor EspC (Type VII ESX diderm) n=1 Tax=Occultella glacieicola TaxID=2518684 RepID=A0ABY2E6F3_9MICO|nr:type VII secretion target [Occultella glacieicola]TDE95091.1 hypothetical protein EXU48_10050 [Occultella glacieicola]